MTSEFPCEFTGVVPAAKLATTVAVEDAVSVYASRASRRIHALPHAFLLQPSEVPDMLGVLVARLRIYCKRLRRSTARYVVNNIVVSLCSSIASGGFAEAPLDMLSTT